MRQSQNGCSSNQLKWCLIFCAQAAIDSETQWDGDNTDVCLIHSLAVTPFLPSLMDTTGFSTQESEQHNHHYEATGRHILKTATPHLEHHRPFHIVCALQKRKIKKKQQFLTKESTTQKNKRYIPSLSVTCTVGFIVTCFEFSPFKSSKKGQKRCICVDKCLYGLCVPQL